MVSLSPAMTADDKEEQVTFRVELWLKAEVMRQAELDSDRTFSSMLRVLIKEGLAYRQDHGKGYVSSSPPRLDPKDSSGANLKRIRR